MMRAPQSLATDPPTIGMITMDPDRGATGIGSGQPALRGTAALLSAALLLGGLLLLVDAEEDRPNTAGKARAALHGATVALSESEAQRQALAEQLHEVHLQLDRALTLLDRAAQLDPADRQEISALKKELQGIEATDRLLDSNPEAIEHTYRDLTTRLNALQQRLGKTRS